MNIKSKFDYVISKDVFEHIEPKTLSKIIKDLSKITKKCLWLCLWVITVNIELKAIQMIKHILLQRMRIGGKTLVKNNFKVKSLVSKLKVLKINGIV